MRWFLVAENKNGPSASKLGGFVSYQKDSVVSREIIRKPAGTVTIFAFDKGQGLSEHIAPFDAFVQVLDGKAEVKIAGQLFEVGTGEFIILPAGKPHALQAISRFKMLLTMIRS